MELRNFSNNAKNKQLIGRPFIKLFITLMQPNIIFLNLFNICIKLLSVWMSHTWSSPQFLKPGLYQLTIYIKQMFYSSQYFTTLQKPLASRKCFIVQTLLNLESHQIDLLDIRASLSRSTRLLFGLIQSEKIASVYYQIHLTFKPNLHDIFQD